MYQDNLFLLNVLLDHPDEQNIERNGAFLFHQTRMYCKTKSQRLFLTGIKCPANNACNHGIVVYSLRQPYKTIIFDACNGRAMHGLSYRGNIAGISGLIDGLCGTVHRPHSTVLSRSLHQNRRVRAEVCIHVDNFDNIIPSNATSATYCFLEVCHMWVMNYLSRLLTDSGRMKKNFGSSFRSYETT